jgi:hypothetical protein
MQLKTFSSQPLDKAVDMAFAAAVLTFAWLDVSLTMVFAPW